MDMEFALVSKVYFDIRIPEKDVFPIYRSPQQISDLENNLDCFGNYIKNK